MKKTTPERPKRPRTTIDGMFSDGVEALGKFVGYANEQLDRDSGNDELATTLASILVKLASVQAEQRKATAEERRRAGKVTMADIMAAIRKLDPTERAAVLREAARIDNERSVLT